MKNLVWIAGVSMLCCGCGPLGSSTTGTASATVTVPPVAKPAMEVTLQHKNFDELQQLIASKKGKIVVVDAWSTYCEPCMKEFPGLVALHTKYGREKVACISLCANYTGVGDLKEESEEPLKFLKAQGATFDNIFATDGDEQLYKKLTAATNVNIGSVPTILVYNADGKLAKVFDGEPTYKDVDAFVATLVK